MNLPELLAKELAKNLGEASEKLSTPDPADWLEKNFYIPETRDDPILRGRLQLQDYQRDVIREALSRDERGWYKYSIIVWSDIKKSIKSTIAAGINLYVAEFNDWAENYIVANDLKQADSRVAHYLRRCLEINKKLGKRYSTRGYRTTGPNGSFLEAIPIDPSGEAGSNATMITFSELWGANQTAQQRMWCLDDQTEALTSKGWKKGMELTVFDEVATYRDGYVTWERPRSIFCENFSGKMHVYEHKNFSMVCTEDHRLFGRYSYRGDRDGVNKYDRRGVMRSGDLRSSGFSYYHPVIRVSGVERTCDLPEGVYLPKTKFHEELFIPWKDWAAFLGLYLTEGSTANFRGVPVHVKISQLEAPHPEKYAEIYKILNQVFGDWVKVDKRDGFKISSTELAKITKQYGTTWFKRVPREIIESNNDVLEAFLHSYILGDGHIIEGSESVQITCASKGLADDLQEIAFRLGYRSSVRKHMIYWRVSILKGSFSVAVQKHNWKEINYTGKVWCPTVSTSLFVARREGRPFITGNSEMTLSPTRQGHSFRWIESYAGYTEESLLLYSLYALGVLQGKKLWPDRLYPVTGGEPMPLELFVNEDAKMLCLWNTVPRCPWQSAEYYRSEEQVLPTADFRRMHRNQWVSSTETFLPMEWFDACRRDDATWPEIDKTHNSFIISLDAGTTNDNFGLFMGCRHPKLPNDVLTVYSQKWAPVNGKIDFQGTEEKPGPERVVRRLVKEYNVVEVAYDPTQLYDLCNRLYKEGLAWFRPFNQGQARLIADSQLRDLVREKHFWHRGEPDLREHFQNANAQIDSEEHKIRIVKRVENLKIDLCVAASMGCHELMRLNL